MAFAQLLKEETLAGIGEGRLMHDAALTADIDLSEAIAQDSDLLPLGGPYMVEIDGEERQMQAAFCGEFNGNGHTISAFSSILPSGAMPVCSVWFITGTIRRRLKYTTSLLQTAVLWGFVMRGRSRERPRGMLF